MGGEGEGVDPQIIDQEVIDIIRGPAVAVLHNIIIATCNNNNYYSQHFHAHHCFIQHLNFKFTLTVYIVGYVSPGHLLPQLTN